MEAMLVIDHSEAMNYIGRSIAQQDTVRMRQTHALETIARCMQSIVLLSAAMMLFMIVMWTR